MKYRTLDENKDYSLGRNLFLNGREAVAQAILTRMYLLYGEWWENTEDGLPLFERILGAYGGNEARPAIDLIISERIQGTTDVTQLREYESSFNAQTRKYQATCSVNTRYGEVELVLTDDLKHAEVKF